MAIPVTAYGYGNNSVARNVFAFNTSEDLSSLITYEAYDNDQSFPALDATNTDGDNTVLAGTSGNSNKSMVWLTDTSDAAPTSDWKTGDGVGESNPNRIFKTTWTVEQDGAILTASDDATFNMVIEVPSDATTSSTMGFDLLVRYTYTGSVPTVKYMVNEGNEGTPTWIDITSGTHGIKHCRSGSTLYANIPAAGTEDTEVGYVTT